MYLVKGSLSTLFKCEHHNSLNNYSNHQARIQGFKTKGKAHIVSIMVKYARVEGKKPQRARVLYRKFWKSSGKMQIPGVWLPI